MILHMKALQLNKLVEAEFAQADPFPRILPPGPRQVL